VRIARTPLGFQTFSVVVPAVKIRQYARYSRRTGSQKARFCESNAPSVITGLSLIGDQWMPSGDLNASSPRGPLERSTALYCASAGQSGFSSLNTAGWPASVWAFPIIPLAMQMLFALEPSNSTSPSSGLRQ